MIRELEAGSFAPIQGAPTELEGKGKAAGMAGLLVCVFLLGAGCDRARATWSMSAAIASEAEEGSGFVLTERRTVFSWRFDDPTQVALWRPHAFDLAYELQDGGLFMRSSTSDAYIVRDGLSINASAVDEILVSHSWLDNVHFQIYWAAPGEAFSEEKSLKVFSVDDSGQIDPTYTFRVHQHPAWSGTIGRIRFDSTIHPERRIKFREVQGIRHEFNPDEQKSAEWAQSAYAIGSDHRVAWSNALGTEKRLALAGPVSGSTLRMGFGLLQHSRKPAIFRLLGDERRVLWERTVTPQQNQWFDERLQLGEFSDDLSEGILLFQATGPSGGPPKDALPVWSGLEVVRKSREPRPPNVVMFIADTLRADRMSLYGNPVQTTPNIDEWAESRGLVFLNATAPAPWTLPSHASLFTGLNAMSHEANHTAGVPDGRRMLAEALRDSGYKTMAVSGGGFVLPSYGFAQGFDRFISYVPILTEESDQTEFEVGLGRVEEWLRNERRSPFFLVFHTYQTHAPYRPNEPWFSSFYRGETVEQLREVMTRPVDRSAVDSFRFDAELFKYFHDRRAPERVEESELALVHALYDSGVARLDQGFGRLLAILRELGLENETILIFLSDHGEGLGEKRPDLGEFGAAGHAFLYDFNLKVPLVMAGPGIPVGRVDDQVGLIDIVPTLGKALGLEFSPVDGVSLLPVSENAALERRSALESYAGSSNRGMSLRIGNRWKYIVQHDAWRSVAHSEQLFDIAVDSSELRSVAESNGELVERLRAELFGRYERNMAKLVVRAKNDAPGPVHFSLRGSLASTLAVKALEDPCARSCLRWERGWARLVLLSGDSVEFFLEGDLATELLIAASLDAEEREFVVRTSGEEVARNPLVIGLAGNEFESGSQTGTGIEIRWAGDGPPLTTEFANSPEARARIRALGYVN